MWKDSIRNIVVTFQTTILRIVGFYVRHSANVLNSVLGTPETRKIVLTLIIGVTYGFLLAFMFLNSTSENSLKG